MKLAYNGENFIIKLDGILTQIQCILVQVQVLSDGTIDVWSSEASSGILHHNMIIAYPPNRIYGAVATLIIGKLSSDEALGSARRLSARLGRPLRVSYSPHIPSEAYSLMERRICEHISINIT